MPALRAANRFAKAMASLSGSPASRRAKKVAPHTSPHPVGSPTEDPMGGSIPLFRVPLFVPDEVRAAGQAMGSGENPGAERKAAPRLPLVTEINLSSGPSASEANS